MVGALAEDEDWYPNKGSVGNYDDWKEEKGKTEENVGRRGRWNTGRARGRQERGDAVGGGQRKMESIYCQLLKSG